MSGIYDYILYYALAGLLIARFAEFAIRYYAKYYDLPHQEMTIFQHIFLAVIWPIFLYQIFFGKEEDER